MAQVVTLGSEIKFTVEGRVGGKVGRFVGVPAWAVDPPLLTLTPTRDGLTCTAVAVAPGDCQVMATAPGLDSGTFAVSVLPADATSLWISAEIMKT
jgi:hypothetical protein